FLAELALLQEVVIQAGMLGIHAHGGNGPVYPDATGQALQGSDGILSIEIDDLGALAAGQVQAAGQVIDGKYPGGAHQPRTGDGELVHRAAAEHGDGITGADLRHFRAEVAGGEDIREQDRLVVGDGVGNLDQADIGVGNTGLFRLQAIEAATGFRPAEKGGAGLGAVRVGAIALGVIAGPAVGAVATGNGGGDDHPVAHLQVAHIGAQGFDDADALVPEDSAWAHTADAATDKMQVGTADGRGGQADNGIGGLMQYRIRYLFQAYVTDIVKNDGFHPLSSHGRCAAAFLV